MQRRGIWMLARRLLFAAATLVALGVLTSGSGVRADEDIHAGVIGMCGRSCGENARTDADRALCRPFCGCMAEEFVARMPEGRSLADFITAMGEPEEWAQDVNEGASGACIGLMADNAGVKR